MSEIRNIKTRGTDALVLELEDEIEVSISELLQDIDSGKLLEDMDADEVREFVIDNGVEPLFEAMKDSDQIALMAHAMNELPATPALVEAVLKELDDERLAFWRNALIVPAPAPALPMTVQVSDTDINSVRNFAVCGTHHGYIVSQDERRTVYTKLGAFTATGEPQLKILLEALGGFFHALDTE